MLVNLLMMKSPLLLLLRDLTQFHAQQQRSEDVEMARATALLLSGTQVPIVETAVLTMTKNVMVVKAVILTASVLGVTLHGKETARVSAVTE